MPIESERPRDTAGQDSCDPTRTTARPPRQESADGRTMQIALVLLGLCGVVVVLLCTSRYGVGLSPDSTNYLSAARSLLAGQGYRDPDGGVYAHWPPLFPTLLAALGLAGVEPAVGARWLNALAFGLIIFLSGRLFLRCTTSRALALTGTVATLASSPLLACSIMAWSEPVFIVLTLLFLLYVPGFLRRKNLAALVLVSLLAGLACLQRYAGVTLILAGAVLIALNTSRASLLQRFKYLAIFGTMAATPLALWCLRNRILAAQAAGGHDFHLASGPALVRALRPAARIVATWLFPWAQPGSLELFGLGLVAAWAGAAIILSRRRRPMDQPALDGDGNDAGGLQIWSAAVFGLVHFGFLVFSTAALGWNAEQRHIVPIYASVVVLVIAGLEGTYRLLPVPAHRRQLAHATGIFLCVLWLQDPLRALVHDTKHHMRDGAGEYSTSGWQESPFVRWLRGHPLPGKVYSNALDAVYALTGGRAATTPFHPWNTAEFARQEFSAQTSYIVWFHGLHRTYLYDLRELRSRYQMQEIAAFPHGGVYQYLGPGGPAVSAVYRFWSAPLGRHLYTLQKAERDRLTNQSDGTWSYEGPVFYAVAPDSERPVDVLPVYRLRSAALRTEFYTIDEAERDRLVAHPSGLWTCAGVAFYAWPEAGRKDTLPVHRFWSQRLGCHFFTISETEKTQLIEQFSDTWTYEGIAWYAYGP